MLRRAALLLALVASGLFLVPRAQAIPAFARKYQVSCTTCHAPFPRLKPYGEEFAARGFRLPDPTQEPARATLDVGDPLLKLPRDFPIAARLDGYASYKQNEAAEADFEFPWAFKLLSGGPIAKKISYYFYIIAEAGGSFGLEDAWFQFNALGGAPIDLQVGQFQVCDPLFKRELRLERYDYLIFTTDVGDSSVNLTYDRGAVASFHLPRKVDLILQVVNGNGIEPADAFDNFDNDSYKNVALRAVGSVKMVRLGGFGYWGRQRGANGAINDTWYLGPDFVFDIHPKWQLNVEYLERRDDNPFFVPLGSPTYVTRGGFAELHFFPKGQDDRWALSLLYNDVTSDDLAARGETVSVTANWLAARNVRIVMEAGRDFEAGQTRVSVGVVAAF